MNVRKHQILLSGVIGLVLLIPRPSLGVTRYVWSDNPAPEFPYDAWTNAAKDIQDAVNAAQEGETVLVTNGVYRTGSRIFIGDTPNRVVINKSILVRSVSGPSVTAIEGTPGVEGGNGEGAVRCAYVGTNATLVGFTITNGHTLSSGDWYLNQGGGGLWCEENSAVSNCVIVGNSAAFGGGAYRGNIYDSVSRENWAYDGAGTFGSIVVGSLIQSNRADGFGGGANSGALTNCLIIGNYASGDGAGAYDLTLVW